MMWFLLVIGVILALVVRASFRSAARETQIIEDRRLRRAKAKVKPLPSRFVVVDLETTGLDPDRHEIIEIGAIKFDCALEVHATFQSLVVPSKRVSSKITEITGLNRKTLVRDGHPLAQILPQFLEFCEDLPIVAFNAKFDRSFVEAACDAALLSRPTGSWICALENSRLAWPGRSSYRLSALCADGGVDLSGEHRALTDCERALRVYVASVEHVLGPQIVRPT